MHEVALKDKEPDTQDTEDVKASGESVGETGAWQGRHQAGGWESGIELGWGCVAEGPGGADGEPPGGPSPAAGPAPGRDQ